MQRGWVLVGCSANILLNIDGLVKTGVKVNTAYTLNNLTSSRSIVCSHKECVHSSVSAIGLVKQDCVCVCVFRWVLKIDTECST